MSFRFGSLRGSGNVGCPVAEQHPQSGADGERCPLQPSGREGQPYRVEVRAGDRRQPQDTTLVVASTPPDLRLDGYVAGRLAPR
jgi:hypothetical protein